jgi:hypothetical protein
MPVVSHRGPGRISDCGTGHRVTNGESVAVRRLEDALAALRRRVLGRELSARCGDTPGHPTPARRTSQAAASATAAITEVARAA